MIKPELFYKWLTNADIDFFSGVPDSLLKDICAYITDHTSPEKHIIAANEGNAVALAAGYHMASGKIPLVYMQNSGLGNIVNPLLSLTNKQVYNIPLLMMIGWRGEPGKKDEPQHVAQGRLTLDLLETMEVPYQILSDDADEAKKQFDLAITHISENNQPYALVIRKGLFERYKLKATIKNSYTLIREEAIKQIVEKLSGNEIIVSTTGKTSRELFEIREALGQGHDSDFLTVGCMGHANQIAVGMAIAKPNRKVICIDGDGALLMHMGSMAINGAVSPKNFIHIVINNGSHESVGGQPTVADSIDVVKIAEASNYKSAISVSSSEALNSVLTEIDAIEGPALIEIKTKVGSRDDLGRPTVKPVDNKKALMQNFKSK
ncbi:phosphonopyruvate decarboxylase [Draconibacterium halophilum]|uniref:Phosphonopyruvate decarboxylase n=1 Tax=Draconibacterium halophilum TaxID=2706887 RepID=A0A6C0RIN1_9BACT|nr:phosphonopyruvate decarboxylase [Draconibacterium halophilum]QIA09712.1 phosphonopyruvate decarboxylase [Draconibacterium halophilum]